MFVLSVRVLLSVRVRVPHPCAFFAQEPALSEAEGVGLHGSIELRILHLIFAFGCRSGLPLRSRS